ncbi:uncharacterized protein LOC122939384 [Bufo gargarizans]|uniref:uncharacterized protein LOC122939384 n=1 Tax=Bufo gargarizans TaxID=30331 RepID=UPI001CF5072F|nr:uncharacterized protein LOC122939384 [Bufo gargarizans]
MLYLCILVALFLSDIQTVTIDQELPSLVKVRGDQSTARIPCEISQSSSTYVHWYVQKKNQVIKRILYFGEGKDNYEDGFHTNKFKSAQQDITTGAKKHTLTINDINDDDSGIYYCASWDTSDRTEDNLEKEMEQAAQEQQAATEEDIPPSLDTEEMSEAGPSTSSTPHIPPAEYAPSLQLGARRKRSMPTAEVEEDSEGEALYESGLTLKALEARFMLTTSGVEGSILTALAVGKLHSDYFKVFGPGSKLVVTHEEAKKLAIDPKVTILASSKHDVRTKKSATLLCNLQSFFPDAIKVEWTDGSNNKLESEQGTIITDASSDLSSLYSWITIKQSDIGSTYKCKYKHEGNGNQWKEETYNTEHLNTGDPTNQIDISNCTYTSGKAGREDMIIKHMIIRSAQFIYALLLLKSLLYCPLLLFFKYKATE